MNPFKCSDFLSLTNKCFKQMCDNFFMGRSSKNMFELFQRDALGPVVKSSDSHVRDHEFNPGWRIILGGK